jgi:hypothetical protein
MYEITNTFLQSELDYRTDRLKAAVAEGRHRHSRRIRVRRSPRSSDILR